VALAGCAAPQYSIRPTPAPVESSDVIQIERQISAVQAREFEQQGASLIRPDERPWGFPVQSIVDRLSQVTERPSLRYRAYLYQDRDPNAAALADGRIYLSSGMLNYLAGRGSRPDELAVVIGHELGHTVAQHLVKRYEMLQRQQLLAALVDVGASLATRGASQGVQGAAGLAHDAISTLQDVADSGYSQEQELEADQLGIRYVMRAGFNPKSALDLLQDFERFDNPSPFLRTHPYAAIRQQYLERYLTETVGSERDVADRIRRLRGAQRLYPAGSVSWKNLQRQLEELDRQVQKR